MMKTQNQTPALREQGTGRKLPIALATDFQNITQVDLYCYDNGAVPEVIVPADGNALGEAARPTEATVFPTGLVEAGKGGEGGDFQITNAEFVVAVIPWTPEGAFAAVSSKGGDPSLGGWPARRADLAAGGLSAETNNYLGCSSFYPSDDGCFKARKTQFAACHFLMLDDLGTKVPLERLEGFELSWLIETSPGNYQGGIILAEPLTDGVVAVRLLNAVIEAGLCDAGATGPLSRWPAGRRC